MNVGDTTTVKAYVSPSAASQDLLWAISDPSLVATEISGNQVLVKALKKGQVIVRASSKDNPAVYQDFVLDILENNLNTNVNDATIVSGDWYVDGESLHVDNHGANDIYMSSQKAPENYQMDLDVKYGRGVVNIFFASANIDPANAYAVQFGDNNMVRLFRFYGDTIYEAPMAAAINDNQFHHVRLVKTANIIAVLVDNQLVMSYAFDQVDDYFNDAYFGLGLWDGELEVQNFFVTDLDAKEPDPKPADDQKVPAKEEASDELFKVEAALISEKAQVSPTVSDQPVQVAKAKLASESILPQTGEKENHLTSLGILAVLSSLVAIFGGLFKKKEQ